MLKWADSCWHELQEVQESTVEGSMVTGQEEEKVEKEISLKNKSY